MNTKRKHPIIDGISQVSTVNIMFISKTVKQDFRFDGKNEFKNPLTSKTELLSIDESGGTLKFIFEHQGWLFKAFNNDAVF